jgi:hypothetical protein
MNPIEESFAEIKTLSGITDFGSVKVFIILLHISFLGFPVLRSFLIVVIICFSLRRTHPWWVSSEHVGKTQDDGEYPETLLCNTPDRVFLDIVRIL